MVVEETSANGVNEAIGDILACFLTPELPPVPQVFIALQTTCAVADVPVDFIDDKRRFWKPKLALYNSRLDIYSIVQQKTG